MKDLIASCQVFYDLSVFFTYESSLTVELVSLSVFTDTFINDMQIAFLIFMNYSISCKCMYGRHIYFDGCLFICSLREVGWFIDNQCNLLASIGNAKLTMYYTPPGFHHVGCGGQSCHTNCSTLYSNKKYKKYS